MARCRRTSSRESPVPHTEAATSVLAGMSGEASLEAISKTSSRVI
jgi:hypothetical protein